MLKLLSNIKIRLRSSCIECSYKESKDCCSIGTNIIKIEELENIFKPYKNLMYYITENEMKREELLKRLNYGKTLLSFNCAYPKLTCSKCLFLVNSGEPCLASLDGNKYANNKELYNYLVKHIKRSNNKRVFTTKSIKHYINKFKNLNK